MNRAQLGFRYAIKMAEIKRRDVGRSFLLRFRACTLENRINFFLGKDLLHRLGGLMQGNPILAADDLFDSHSVVSLHRYDFTPCNHRAVNHDLDVVPNLPI